MIPIRVARGLVVFQYDANDPVFKGRQGSGWLTERAVHAMMKVAAKAAGINTAVSPHWLRHAHGSHAIERGASLPEVRAKLGHGNISTTSGYLHARPPDSSPSRRESNKHCRFPLSVSAVSGCVPV